MIHENQESTGSSSATGSEGSNWPSFEGFMQDNVPVPKSVAPRYYINSEKRCVAEFKGLNDALKFFEKHQRPGWFFTAYDPSPEEYEEELRQLRQEQRTRPYL